MQMIASDCKLNDSEYFCVISYAIQNEADYPNFSLMKTT